MKILNFIFAFIIVATVFSCSSDDDICTSGEATPRIKLKFKTQATNKLRTLDTLYVDIDYGNGPIPVINPKIKADSVLLPLRVDGYAFTDIYIRTAKKGNKSKIRINHTTTTQYVSPPCGIKKLYENVSANLLTSDPVLGVEQVQNQIINEEKTHYYLLF